MRISLFGIKKLIKMNNNDYATIKGIIVQELAKPDQELAKLDHEWSKLDQELAKPDQELAKLDHEWSKLDQELIFLSKMGLRIPKMINFILFRD
jgi:predicted nuclease with TOPRIM domain